MRWHTLSDEVRSHFVPLALAYGIIPPRVPRRPKPSWFAREIPPLFHDRGAFRGLPTRWHTRRIVCYALTPTPSLLGRCVRELRISRVSGRAHEISSSFLQGWLQ